MLLFSYALWFSGHRGILLSGQMCNSEVGVMDVSAKGAVSWSREVHERGLMDISLSLSLHEMQVEMFRKALYALPRVF